MASRDSKEGATNLLRQSLRDSGDGCPGPDILAAYFERSLDAQQSARYELHLSHCARCREQLAALDRTSAPAAAGGRQPHGFWHWAWLRDWRWLAPVTAVLIVFAVWIAKRPTLRQADKPQQLVAMSQPQQAPAASTEQEDRSAPNAVPSARRAPRATAPPLAKEAEADSLERKSEKAARDFGVGGSNLNPPPTVSRNTAVSPPPPPPASGNGAAPALGGSPRQVMATSDAETIAPQPSPMEMKSNPASAAARVSARRAKDAGVPPQALTLEAVARHPIVHEIATPDPKVVWRIGAGGGVDHSEDSGASWHGQLPDAGAQLTAGSAPSEKICWLVGRDGVIFLTSNAKDWKRIPPPVRLDFVAITAEDVSTATVTTADGRKFTTSDGGIHWNPAL